MVQLNIGEVQAQITTRQKAADAIGLEYMELGPGIARGLTDWMFSNGVPLSKADMLGETLQLQMKRLSELYAETYNALALLSSTLEQVKRETRKARDSRAGRRGMKID